MTRRARRRLGLLAALLALGAAALAGADAWWVRAEYGRARADLKRGRVEPALRRLSALAAARPGALGGAVDYWLGLCESSRGHPEAALRAFGRVPEGFPFDSRGAVAEAGANLQRGRLRAAERRLEQALARGGPELAPVRALLVRVYQIEVRFDDVRALLLDGLRDAHDPAAALRQISDLELGRLPYDGLRVALEDAGRLAPDDSRVWLGKGRLALSSGRWDEAATWLRRCRDDQPDAPVWRAWIDWARGAGRPDEVAAALRHLEPTDLSAAEQSALLAWLHERRGDLPSESAALERWLTEEPANPQALERLAGLAQRAGDLDRAAALRHRKAEADRALDTYRLRLRGRPPTGAAEWAALARLAEAAGRHREADSLRALAGAEAVGTDQTARSHEETWAALLRTAQAPTSAREPPTLIVPTFADEADAAGLRFVYENGETLLHQLPEPFGGGVALLDFDGDGWLDVYCVQGGRFPPDPAHPPAGDRLFRNLGNGAFADVTESSGIVSFPRGYGHGVTVGDFDNDGHPDLFVTRWRAYALYRNNGDGTFADVTEASGLGGARDWPTSAAFVDLDGDGDLDLYVCHYAAWDAENPRLCRDGTTGRTVNCNPLDSPAMPDHLFRNDGGRFVDVTAEAGIDDRDGRGLGVVAADLDGDGLVDLYVANDGTANYLFRNLGGLRFAEVGHESGVAANAAGGYQAGMGVALGDLDGDGLPDLAVTNFLGESTTFYRNLGGGIFGDQTAAIGLAAATRHRLGFGVVAFDANNDGRLDLASANGHVNDLLPHFAYFMPAQLLLGTADGRLVDVSARAGPPWSVPRMGRALAAGDLDNDGQLDLVLLAHNQPLAYLHNRTADGGPFVVLRLEGRPSNRDAIGATVALTAGGRRQVAWRFGGGSYQSSGDPRLHFGLGKAERVDRVEVTWPSGRVETFEDLEIDAGYLLREGESRPAPLPGYGPRRR
jgi:tetratricopeptide (TPR) repeat protein